MTSISKSSGSQTQSSFYLACSYGRVDEVRNALKTMSLKEIDRIEPNGSTALHAACYRGHKEVVELLLKRGARRSIKNKHQATAYDEASEEIKKLFLRPVTSRFHSDDSEKIDWMKTDEEAAKIAADFRFRHTGFGWSEKNTIHRLQHIKGDMSDTDNEQIQNFLDEVNKDPVFLLRAYSAETGFYKSLNKDLAKKHFDAGTNFGLTYFIDFFYNHPKFESFSFIGDSYRGMSVSKNDLVEYRVGNRIMNKAFLSSSIDKEVALNFAKKSGTRETLDGTGIKISALCIFTLVNHRSGLLIENVSEFKHEREVLIGPYTAFLIRDLHYINPTYVEINLVECKMESKADLNDDDDEL